MSNSTKNNLATLFILPFTIPIMLILFFWQGWVVNTLWQWFAVPAGLPILSLIQTTGLLLIYNVINFDARKILIKNSTEESLTILAAVVVNPLYLLILGYILKTFFL